MTEQIESMRLQARAYEDQVRAEAQRYKQDVAVAAEAARANLHKVEDRAVRDLAQANAQQLAACAEALHESSVATSLSSQTVQLKQQLVVLWRALPLTRRRQLRTR